jgi:uncharacterized protein (UPF0305 family)
MQQIDKMYQKDARIYEEICRSCRRISAARTRGEAGTLMAQEISTFSLFDLQVIMGRLRYEVHRLPLRYRKVAAPYLLAQVVETHHQLLTLFARGEFSRMVQSIREKDLFDAYFSMVPDGCFVFDSHREYLPQFHSPRHRLFYYILAGFAMFVLERPGHPVGTPFPGGSFVREYNGKYYCPVRDKQKEVFFSLCNYCPAIQDGEV